jgi:transcriptional regulator with XRE-family HTH domain
MSLSELIKQKRKKNGLSQVELAERAGVGLRLPHY